MKCPVCLEVNLVMTDRQGIEVGYCPQCRGVWLDRGELDKIIERSAAPVAQPSAQWQQPDRQQPPPQQSQSQQRIPESRPRPEQRDYDDDDDRYDPRKKKKRGGFLGELFDFD